jgi:DNA polymerase (family 10)
VSEYGVFKGKRAIAGKDEEEVYAALGLPWMPPELREDRGEIAAAQENRLPDLIELKDIKGDLQTHSTYSDGSNSIEEMALAAKKRGYEYICITDHSRSLKVASGLEIDELEERTEEIARLNKKLKGIRILNGAEVDILGDGRLDYPDEVLEKLDIVLGAIHSALGQEEKKMTARLLSAIENPNVDIIAHPTGRVFGQRGPSNIDLERIMKAAAETKTVLEIDAYYDRLDLNDTNARMARDMGVKLEISTDAHHTDQLWMMELGVAVARRGWLTSSDVINTLPADKLLKWIRSK